MDKQNPLGYCLVTGASFGIGFEFAKVFAENGHDLILVARTQNKLEDLAHELTKTYPVKVKVISKDLTLESDRLSLFSELKSENIFVEILVNNAGFGLSGDFDQQPEARQLEMIDLNIAALTHLSRLFLPEMLKKKTGYLLNVASTAAFVPGPLMAVYYATKAYVVSLSEALASEYKERGIRVMALCPGATRTEFQKIAAIENTRLFKGPGVMEPKRVAEFGYEQLFKGTVVAIPGFRNKFLKSTVAFAPRSLLAKTIKKFNSSRKP